MNEHERQPMGAAELPEEQEHTYMELPDEAEEQKEAREAPRTFLLNTVPNSGNTTNNPDNNIVPIGHDCWDYSR